MNVVKTKFKDLLIYNKNTYKDKRGYFRELFLNKDFNKKFPFDVMSFSKSQERASSTWMASAPWIPSLS